MADINASSRSAAADDEGHDHLGLDTPRSGIATPQPDLHDKRLPGIMSYFGQVRPSSFTRLLSGTFSATGLGASWQQPAAVQQQQGQASWASTSSGGGSPPLLPHERVGPPSADKPTSEDDAIHPFPTPCTSQRGSMWNLATRDPAASTSSRETPFSSRPPSYGHSSVPDVHKNMVCRPSLLAPLTTTVDVSSVMAQRGFPWQPHASTSPNSPARSRVPSGDERVLSLQSALVTSLRKLTEMAAGKSGNSTPSRALSLASAPQSESQEERHLREDGESLDCTAIHTPASSTGGAPAAKGKLTVKITEARGLRKCRDPYVVAVFQRSELISDGPRSTDDEDDAAIASVAMGGVPVQRQGSDSGRPMAIPMRSRQSSNTSLSDFNTFRTRNLRLSFTNPKWDAEAVFDVVDSDMHVDISVYGQTIAGQELLGHVNFEPKMTENGIVRGWYALKGHVDTMAENTPTGEVYVEALYQRSEKRHFGPQDFQILRLIGKGTFGQVYQVRKRDTGRIYAMKVLSKKVIVQKKEVAHTVGERNILVRTATSESPFIVSLKFSFQTPSDLYLVTDYMSGGELFWHLQKEGRFDEKRAKFYITELILAIQHLHQNDIVYRDLKPENILLDANGHIALCDFGLSKANLTKNDTTNTFCGTTEYLAPEVLLDETGYTKMVDFWSLGVLVFEMCCGWSPFYADETQQMYKNIAFGKVRFPRDTLSLEGRNFVKGLLNRNPKHRLGAIDDAEELKRHAFFADIDWDALGRKLITPPFKPTLKNDTDVSYFDPEFTNAMSTNGSLNERATALANGFSASTPLSPSVQANFQGFTFVDESALDDHMKDRFDDQVMNDADRKRDNWNNEMEHKSLDRMSGILRSNPVGEHQLQFEDV